ncbi:hypothetical protein CFP65_4252 [Kitasatospora sp. MMS16-BH015]|uniref:hypothetical protein n=1 Tax=Kitasatospora sp. MMS16-BH015 TaxID=2018025 RepID=UPI000CA135B9|nr:hypothetical protein [Kitasatospora sp. MMS16-BH015]AUG79006.1 hypothetical protein CFP65_4252 [Kitasatospora sp. MMS16-BH015]
MKKIATLAALTLAGLALAAPAATASAAPALDPKLAETDATLSDFAGLPVIAPYAADIQDQIRHTPVR